MDAPRSRRLAHRGILYLTLLLALAGSASAQPKKGTRWEGRIFVQLVAGDSIASLAWQLDTAGLRAWLDTVLTTTVAGVNSDSLDALASDTTGRRINPKNLGIDGATADQVLGINGTRPAWITPNLADKISAVGWLQSTIFPHNISDTSGHKHVFLWTPLDRELPVAHATQYSAIGVSLAVRYTNPVATTETYSAIWVGVGGGIASVQQGDRLIVRFFPQNGTGTDKLLKLYRLPDNTPLYNSYYGEQIGTLTVPASKFPALSSDQCNLTLTLTFKVK